MTVPWWRGGGAGSTWSSQLTPGYLPDWICSSSHGLSLSRPACCMLRVLLEPRRHGSLTGDSKLCTAAQLRWDHIWCWDTQPPRSSNQRQVQRSSRPSTNPPSQSRIFILRRRHFVRRNNCGYISFQHSVRTTTFRFIYFFIPSFIKEKKNNFI